MNAICIDINIFNYWRNNVVKLAAAIGQCLSFVASGYSRNSIYNVIYVCTCDIYSYNFKILKPNYSYWIPENAIEGQYLVLEISRPEYERHLVWKG